MVSSAKLEFAVLGSGPAGLSVSIFLRKLGHKVTVFERFEQAQPVGAGLMLQPTGMSVLHKLDLLEQVYSASQQVNQIIGMDASSNRTVLDVHYSYLGGNRFGLGTHRHVLFQTLFDEAVHQGVQFEFGKTITDVLEVSGGVSPITVQGQQLPEFDLVINASGSDSPVANELFGLQSRPLLPFGALWGVVDLPDDGFDHSVLSQRYCGAKIMIGVLPLGLGNSEAKDNAGNKAAIFWSLPGNQYEQTMQEGIAAWQDSLCSYWPEMKPLVSQVKSLEDLSLARYRHYTLKKPYKGRVVSIGDAYHSTSPQLGQGANMALLDAMALAHSVSINAERPERIGSDFHQLRNMHINIFQTTSISLTPMYQSESRLIGMFRDWVIAPSSRIPPVPKLMAALLSGLFWKPFASLSGTPQRQLKLDEPDWLQFAAKQGAVKTQ